MYKKLRTQLDEGKKQIKEVSDTLSKIKTVVKREKTMNKRIQAEVHGPVKETKRGRKPQVKSKPVQTEEVEQGPASKRQKVQCACQELARTLPKSEEPSVKALLLSSIQKNSKVEQILNVLESEITRIDVNQTKLDKFVSGEVRRIYKNPTLYRTLADAKKGGLFIYSKDAIHPDSDSLWN